MNKNSGMLLKDGEDRLYLVRYRQPTVCIIAYRVDSNINQVLGDNGVQKTKVFKGFISYHEWVSSCQLVGYID